MYEGAQQIETRPAVITRLGKDDKMAEIGSMGKCKGTRMDKEWKNMIRLKIEIIRILTLE